MLYIRISPICPKNPRQASPLFAIVKSLNLGNVCPVVPVPVALGVPSTYNIVNRSFNKGKGSEIQLSPEEIEMNRGIAKAISPEAHNPSTKIAGQGIRGRGSWDAFGDKVATNLVKSKLEKEIKEIESFNPMLVGLGKL